MNMLSDSQDSDSRIFSQDSHFSSITGSFYTDEGSQESKDNNNSTFPKLNFSAATVPLFSIKNHAEFLKKELATAHKIFSEHGGATLETCDCLAKHLTASEIEKRDVKGPKPSRPQPAQQADQQGNNQEADNNTTATTSTNTGRGTSSSLIALLTSILRGSVKSNTTPVAKRIDYNYSIGVHVANPREIRPLGNLCQRAFLDVYGISRKTLMKVQTFVKTGNHEVCENEFNDNTGAYSLDTVEDLAAKLGQPGIGFELCGDDVPIETIRAMAIPDKPETKLCIGWMSQHFDMIGDKCPKSREIHLEKCEKLAIYQRYCADIGRKVNPDELVSYSHFVATWDKFFPHVKIRTYKAVTGKCAFCAVLTEARQQFHRNDARQYITDLHALHRATYMSERCVYYKKINRALLEPKRFMSIIMDGMSQNHTQLPYLGNMKDFPATLDMHLQGVIEHAQEFAIYRTYANLKDDANSLIHSFLMQLESRMQRDQTRTLPDTIFIQVDGGAENANQWLLGICELLVIKRLTRRIYLTRLPVGHTHEDIDAKFGKLWDHNRNKVIITPQAYGRELHRTFGARKPHFVCHDVFVVPDYKCIVDPFIDDNLERWTKVEHTQLCWRFSAVDRCAEFPLGVQTMYRAYANDLVFEVFPDEESPIKWSAKVTVCSWQPQADPLVLGSHVDGLYLLQGLPRGPIVPAAFERDHTQKLKKTLSYVKDPKWYGTVPGSGQKPNPLNAQIISEWDQFATVYPNSDDVTHYVEEFEMYIPLKDELFGDMEVLCNYTSASKLPSVGTTTEDGDLENTFLSSDFEDPHNVNKLVSGLPYQYSTPSVVWKNRGKSLPFYPPRVNSKVGMLEDFKVGDLEKLRVEELLKPLSDYEDITVREITEILELRGVAFPKKATRPQLLELLKRLDGGVMQQEEEDEDNDR